MTNKEVIEAMNRMKVSSNQEHNDLIKLLHSNHSLTLAEIGALQDKMTIQFKEVNRRLDIANGTLKDHSKDIADLKTANKNHIIECPVMPEIKKLHNEIISVEDKIIGPFIRRHWKSLVFGCLISYFIMYVLFESFKLIDLIKILK